MVLVKGDNIKLENFQNQPEIWGTITWTLSQPEEIKQTKLIVDQFQDQEKPEVKTQKWMTRRELLSSEWTTDWDQIPLAF